MSDTLSGVAVVGSANLDLVVEVSRPPHVGETLLGHAGGRYAGGKGLNQAVAAARSGAPTRFCAVVGQDEAGDELQRTLTDAGVAGVLRRTEAAPTGIAHVLALDDGDNSIIVAAGANAELGARDAVDGVAGAAVVLAQLEVPVPSVAAALRAAREWGALTLLNAAPAAAAALDLLPDVDILIVNETECAELGGVERLHAAGAAQIVLTRGAGGVTLHRIGAEPLYVTAFRIDPVDTTGAGDAFCGAFAAALAGGDDIGDALDRACAAGAIVAQHRGANTAALSAAAITELVATR
ncbi:PfkB family carbohydrate kinase [Microbacterium saperdae]|uniref:Ribokinase n=1 Tax=Microbacterium saperdae TaxID=69368 RepID=A0A543BJM0_9MICO|nr:PfkB family carbohydrate kinase [Microbacterium saperdae]TQL85006.1 ribokinase [Microbacterium saperdae]GGM57765.1 ribokinase [Microbacterium saperdae]